MKNMFYARLHFSEAVYEKKQNYKIFRFSASFPFQHIQLIHNTLTLEP